MKKLLLSFALAGMLLATNGQDAGTGIKRCGSYEVYQLMLQNDPTFAKNQESIEQFTQNFIKNGGAAMRTEAGTPVYTIPVVVHVVYNTASQNINTAQIQSQVTVLNEDFQKLNIDVGLVPPVWTSLVANCKVQFCLASLDPDGNATTGIRRVHTTKTSFNSNNDVKFTSKGGDDAWPAASYLNIWVCKLGGGLLGYAQFPGGNAATDGVVIAYTAFGNTGTAQAPYDLGRTATHEIGHWLNLRHIWGDDFGLCSGSDMVGDTPNQGNSNFGCPTFPKISCSNGPNGEMFMNFMDYTDDDCMFMFTKGQKTRMKATLVTGGSRHSVTVSGKCGFHPVSLNQNNLIDQSLLTVSPNPVNGSFATVSYKLGKASEVRLIISNMYGNVVASLNRGSQTAGNYQLKPEAIGRLQNGMYIMRLVANGEQLAAVNFVVTNRNGFTH